MANLAVKGADLEGASGWYAAAGATVSDPIQWENGRRADGIPTVRGGAI